MIRKTIAQATSHAVYFVIVVLTIHVVPAAAFTLMHVAAFTLSHALCFVSFNSMVALAALCVVAMLAPYVQEDLMDRRRRERIEWLCQLASEERRIAEQQAKLQKELDIMASTATRFIVGRHLRGNPDMLDALASALT